MDDYWRGGSIRLKFPGFLVKTLLYLYFLARKDFHLIRWHGFGSVGEKDVSSECRFVFSFLYRPKKKKKEAVS